MPWRCRPRPGPPRRLCRESAGPPPTRGGDLASRSHKWVGSARPSHRGIDSNPFWCRDLSTEANWVRSRIRSCAHTPLPAGKTTVPSCSRSCGHGPRCAGPNHATCLAKNATSPVSARLPSPIVRADSTPGSPESKQIPKPGREFVACAPNVIGQDCAAASEAPGVNRGPRCLRPGAGHAPHAHAWGLWDDAME